MKARFTEQQPPVKVIQKENIAYVFICLNETEGTETYPDMGEGESSEHYYEYDYNEIIGPKTALPLDDIQEKPENYLDYKYIQEPNDPGERALAEIVKLKDSIERGLTE